LVLSQLPAGIGQAGKPVFVEALVAQLAVEAFGIWVLCGFSRSDEIDADTVLVCPLVQGFAGEFGSVVHEEGFGLAMVPDEPVEDTTDPQTWQGRVDLGGQAAAAENRPVR